MQLLHQHPTLQQLKNHMLKLATKKPTKKVVVENLAKFPLTVR